MGKHRQVAYITTCITTHESHCPMPTQKLTDAFVRNVKPPKKGQVTYFDRELVLRLSHGGKRTWRCVYYVDSKPHYEPLGFYDPDSNDPKSLTLAEARKKAIDIVTNVKKGHLPRDKESKKDDRIESVVADYMKREGSKTRTAREKQRIFDRYVIPAWGNKLITDIRRRDVNDLLDQIEDGGLKGKSGKKLKGGAVMADRALAHISRMFNWFAAKDERFRSPIVRGMKRTKAKERQRDRILSDDEIRIIWPLLPSSGMFGQVLKQLFLTAQRRSDVSDMLRTEIDGEHVWTIPAERYKTKRPHYVPLTDPAIAVINAQPQIDESDLIFTLNGRNGFDFSPKANANWMLRHWK